MKIDIAAAAAPVENYLNASNLASALTKGVGGYMKGRAARQQAEREAEASQTLSNALMNLSDDYLETIPGTKDPMAKLGLEQNLELIKALQGISKQGLLESGELIDALGKLSDPLKLSYDLERAKIMGQNRQPAVVFAGLDMFGSPQQGGSNTGSGDSLESSLDKLKQYGVNLP